MVRLLVGLLGCLLVAGCLAGPGAAPASPDVTEAPTVSSESQTEAPVLTFEYDIDRGTVADTVSHVYVEFGVYTAERASDVIPCTDGAPLMDNRYDPTPTPVRTPAGNCTSFDAQRIDLTTLNGSRTLGPFRVPANRANAHTLVVHDVTLVLENGSTASAVYDTDFRAITETAPPSGTYGIEVNVTDYGGTDRDVPWRFGISLSRVDGPSA